MSLSNQSADETVSESACETLRSSSAARSRPPAVVFDPSIAPPSNLRVAFGEEMVEGLRMHLWRYGAIEGVRHALSRLEDPEWLPAWNDALAEKVGSAVLLHGSELGVLASLAHVHGAARVGVIESHPLTGRIAEGLIRKNRLMAWHQRYGAGCAGLSEAEKAESFEKFCADLHLLPCASQDPDLADYDCVAFADLDHTLLGTGIAAALKRLRERGLPADAQVLPGGAAVFAMPIQWVQESSKLALGEMDEFRWSFYPEVLDGEPSTWTALGPPVKVGEIDFQSFCESDWHLPLPIHTAGTAHAIVFWFELELGPRQLRGTEKTSPRCLRPAVQHIDPLKVQSAETLELSVAVREAGIRFTAIPISSRTRYAVLPSWYMPMLFDSVRNSHYQTALDRLQVAKPLGTVLDIGSGCGMLSMMAARAGAPITYGCESDRQIFRAGQRVVQANGFGAHITAIQKDWRDFAVPMDMPKRADLVVFELFDASLIGEGVLYALSKARECLLESNARYLPMAARIRGMVVEYRLNQAFGVDLQLLNPFRYSPTFLNVDAQHLGFRALSAPFDVFEFDFTTATPAPQRRELSVAATADGTASAILFWFDLQLGQDHWLSNEPTTNPSAHWKQGLQFVQEMPVTTAMQLPIQASHNGSALGFNWRTQELPTSPRARLPPFDFMTQRYAMELQAQTAQLLQRCQGDPEEYGKVARLAQAFALSPATYGLDPIVAQRFASLFMTGQGDSAE
jgi:type II protein arginine methyltransferase